MPADERFAPAAPGRFSLLILLLLSALGYGLMALWFPLAPNVARAPAADIRTFAPTPLGGLAYALLTVRRLRRQFSRRLGGEGRIDVAERCAPHGRRGRSRDGLRVGSEGRVVDHGLHLRVAQRAERAGARILIGSGTADRERIAAADAMSGEIVGNAEVAWPARRIPCAHQAEKIERLDLAVVERIARVCVVVAGAFDDHLQRRDVPLARAAVPVRQRDMVAVARFQQQAGPGNCEREIAVCGAATDRYGAAGA